MVQTKSGLVSLRDTSMEHTAGMLWLCLIGSLQSGEEAVALVQACKVAWDSGVIDDETKSRVLDTVKIFADSVVKGVAQ